MKKSINIHKIGIKGGQTKITKTGYARLETNNGNSISVDAYQGQGATYKERTEEEVQIIFADKTQWTGTFNQLKKQLS